MAETSKYDNFMEELTSLEKQIYFFIQKSEELLKDREKNEKRISQLETENEVLALKLNEIESKSKRRRI